MKDQLKRNTVTQLKDLTVGDRFYFQSDSGKRIYEVIECTKDHTVYAPNRFAKRIRANNSVREKNIVYLRNSNTAV